MTKLFPSDAKPLFWIGSSRKDVRRFPKKVRVVIGQALFDAQTGYKHPDVKPLKGFRGAGVLEIMATDTGDAYRGIYTVQMAGAVYVLHAFKKKSKTGIRTPEEEMATVRKRLREAEAHHTNWRRDENNKS